MNLFKNLALLVSGALLMLAALYIWRPDLFKHVTDMHVTSATNDADKPLYWVAPMDPNYRRDAAGKSPMGMDLVPVYAKDQNGDESSPGTIEISPEVVNNLGVRTGKVVLDHLRPEIRTVGYLQYNQDSIVHIHPRVEGWVENSYVNTVGAPVEQGQRLYTLHSPALVNAQEELLFGLKRDDQRLIQAAEQRLLALQISDTVIRQLKRDRQVSQTVTFYAPASGVVEELNIREGLYVKPGMTLMSIANLDEIWIEAEVFERQASLVTVGLPVEVDLDFLPGEVRQAKVDYIYPSLDAQTRTLRVRVRLDNSDYALNPNMFAELRILASDQNERLLIPKEALIRGGAAEPRSAGTR
ncbi:efflux RND transporter periplasmic adaptor subunit [Marinobacter sp. ELB17]|uniref:efflux RND transporter periplasmic adaptor subunit n=1 Tax=Marinobacter sp. ELB17 TaxID=270374 RepID=UPI0000F3B4FB|nr:efflux RND transporter periplasmic adaptor subunit [Marinobacter sp. ELB17]EAZ98414.1 Membrane-fusion protein-like [Marinobacter sp. ELB17]